MPIDYDIIIPIGTKSEVYVLNHSVAGKYFMAVIIRKANMEDYDDLCRIYSELDEFHREMLPELFVEPSQPGRTKEYLTGLLSQDDRNLLVAETGDGVMGLAECRVMEPSDFPANRARKWVQVDSLAVREGYRNGRLGFLLMEKVKEWAKSKDIFRIELKVYSLNEGAVSFYHRSGFEDLSVTMYFNL